MNNAKKGAAAIALVVLGFIAMGAGGDKPDPKPDPKPEPEPEPEPVPKPIPKPDPAPVPKPDPAPVPKPDPAPVPKPAPAPAPKPDDIPKPGPLAVPPDGPITYDERKQADLTVALMPNWLPNTVEAIPKPYNQRGALSAEDWAAWVTFWALYYQASGKWQQDGNKAGPYRDLAATWKTAWLRIRTYVVAQLAAENPLASKDPREAPGVTAAEMSAAEKLADYAKIYPDSPEIRFYIDAPTKKMQNMGTRSMAKFLANRVYWDRYANAKTSAWIKDGGAPAPWVADAVWGKVWLRIHDYLANTLKVSDKDAVSEAVPPAGGITEDEILQAKVTLLLYPNWIPNKVENVPAPENQRGGLSALDWATWITYWALYYQENGKWIASGNAPGPYKNLSKTWKDAWERIRVYIGANA